VPVDRDTLDTRSPDGLKPVPSEPSKSTAFNVADGARFGKFDPFTEPTRSTDELPGTEGSGMARGLGARGRANTMSAGLFPHQNSAAAESRRRADG
jgi:hypothetical protein